MILTVTLNASIDKRYVVENFQPGEVNRVKECVYTPGGKGLNVSKAAVAAGAEVTATGFVGGFAGRYIEETLQPFGVKAAFVHLQGESRSCINIWDSTKQTQTEFLEPGFAVTLAEFDTFVQKFTELLPMAEVVVMSGSVPKGLDKTTYRQLVDAAKKAGKKVILDTSGDLLTEGIQAAPTLIKPNIDEIRMLTQKACDREEELIEAARGIQKNGVEYVVISLGGDGSLLICEQGVFRARVPKIETVNTVGCGDCMIAGFALGLSRKDSAEEMLRLASAISAASALREETGFFVKEDMQALYAQIEIVKLQ